MSTCIYSAIRTPDGTVLVSRDTHDYKTHVDAVTGETYMIDGGLDYMRTFVNQVPAENLSVFLEDGIEKIREVFSWGSRGKDGKQLLHYILLKDMDADHIEAILRTQTHISKAVRTAFELELKHRFGVN